MKPRRVTALVPVIYSLLTFVLTYPLLFNLTDSLPNDIGDPLLNSWILAWDAHALLNDPLDLFNANIFHPLPHTLAYSEHLFSTAVLALPVQLISGEPILAYNLSLLLSFPLAAWGIYLLSLNWTGQRSAAFIAGLIFGFAPYRFAAIAHVQLLTFQWLPFMLLVVDKLVSSSGISHISGVRIAIRTPVLPKTRHTPDSSIAAHPNRRTTRLSLALMLLIFLLFQILASWYLALYSAIILGLYLLVILTGHNFRLANARLLMTIFLMTSILTIPFIWPYLDLVDELRAARPLALALSLAATPTDFIAAAPFNTVFGALTEPFRNRSGFTEENTLFSGIIAPLLALIALLMIIKPKTLGPAGAGSTRPATTYTRHIFLLILLILTLLLTLPAPYAAMANLIPPTTIVRVPPRWMIPALFALSLLAGFGYARLNERLSTHPKTRAILLMSCAVLLTIETLSIPLPLARVENHKTLNPAYTWLAKQAQSNHNMALVELPLHSAPAPEFPEVKRLYASTLGWWRLVNGYSGYTPPRQPELAQALADFPDHRAIEALQILAAQLPIDNELLPNSLDGSNASSTPPLFLLIHPGEAPLDRSQWETGDRWRAERHPALYPLGQFEGDYIYRVLPIDPDRFAAPPLTSFGLDRRIHLLQVSTDIPSDSLTPYPPRTILMWQAAHPLDNDYTVFIHLRAADGFVRNQADGPPVSNHYPTSSWQPGEIIQDIHPLPPGDFSQVDHLVIGLYDPATGQRLPAFGPDGQRLADDALIVPIPR